VRRFMIVCEDITTARSRARFGFIVLKSTFRGAFASVSTTSP
jgi:hypothetical protein